MKEGTWISPEGKLIDTTGLTHQSFAKDILKKEGAKPSEAARRAAKNTNFYRPDAGPEFFELLKRGWVRQRGCDFSVWKMNNETAMSIAIGIKKLHCSGIIVEELTEKGQGRVFHWNNTKSMIADFAGLPRAKKATRPKKARKTR